MINIVKLPDVIKNVQSDHNPLIELKSWTIIIDQYQRHYIIIDQSSII